MSNRNKIIKELVELYFADFRIFNNQQTLITTTLSWAKHFDYNKIPTQELKSLYFAATNKKEDKQKFSVFDIINEFKSKTTKPIKQACTVCNGKGYKVIDGIKQRCFMQCKKEE